MNSAKKILVLLALHVGSTLFTSVLKELSPGVSAFTTIQPTRSDRDWSRGILDSGPTAPAVDHGKRTAVLLQNKSPSSSAEQEDLLQSIRSMRVKELKAELEERKISTADAFEKEELVKRLYNARVSSPEPPKAKASSTKPASSAKQTDPNVIRGELSFVSMESGGSIAGTYNSESVQITDAATQPYPTMTIRVADGGFPLKLLVDTACSGLVLNPSVVRKNNMKSDNRAVSMSGAGGSTTNFGTTQIDRFTYGDNGQVLGPLLAAVQDIGALGPLGLDGIIGLSFLGQYACTEIDLERSQMNLYKTDFRPPYDESDLEVVAEGELSPTRLGIWTVDTAFDIGTGKPGKPIKMLVDTGSTSTILNWRGLEQGLGMSRTSPEVRPQAATGAIGSDNVAMSLTHRIEVDQPVRFGTPRGRSPPRYNGLAVGDGQPPLAVDIGEIAILDTQLAAENVGGILGMNVLSRASMIRMVFSGPIPRITLYQKTKSSSTNSSDATKSANDGIDADNVADNVKSKDSSPDPTPTVEPDTDVDIPTITPPTQVTEETKPRKKKKKRRY